MDKCEKKKIEKLDPAFMGTNAGSAGASLDEVVLKINEVIDVLNGEPELCESEDEKAKKIIASIFSEAGNRYIQKSERDIVLAYLEKQKEQKPVEKQDYSGLNDLERAIHRGFLSAGVENVPVTIIKETAQDCLAQMKPANLPAGFYVTLPDGKKYYTKEMRCNNMKVKVVTPQPPAWSEEDESMRWNIISLIGHSNCVQADDMIAWLKSLRPCPSWKPSEEQMEALMLAIEGKCPPTSYMFRRLEDLYDGLANTYGIDAKLD